MVAGVLLVTSCGGGTEGLLGQELYNRSCAACHASDGSGGAGLPLGPGSNAVDLSDGQLFGAIEVGPGTMPSFDRLTDQQITSLVEYVRDLQDG